jgi:hypothetical protein
MRSSTEITGSWKVRSMKIPKKKQDECLFGDEMINLSRTSSIIVAGCRRRKASFMFVY